MKAIIKRELYSYFNSAIGYIFLIAFLLFGGILFFIDCLAQNNSKLTFLFSQLIIITPLLVTFLTMRLISEEKKQKTDQLLLTSPINLFSIVFGKYLAALTMYSLGISITFLYGLTINIFTPTDWTSFLVNLLGLWLWGASLIGIGLFISSLTESQIVAAIISFAVFVVFIFFLDPIANFIPNELISSTINKLSFYSHYYNFTMGILNIPDLVFFVSIAALFIFLTSRSLEKKRWN